MVYRQNNIEIVNIMSNSSSKHSSGFFAGTFAIVECNVQISIYVGV